MARKPAEDRKAEIIATLLLLADRIGPDRVTTGAVAQAIGVTQAALFRHFPTKAALWLAAAQHLRDGMTEAWDAALADQTAPLVRLQALADAQLVQITATPALPMLLFSRELGMENAALREALRSILSAFLARLTQEVAAAQAAGQLTAAIAPADAAALLASTIQGVAIRWVLGAREVDLRGEGARLVAVQLRLLAA